MRGSNLIERLLQATVERTVEILANIKAIPVKSSVNMVYCSGSKETTYLLNRMRINPPDRVLTGALPK